MSASENDFGTPKKEPWENASIRFAGDSGDGMQLTGNRFATISASLGDDVITLADYPSEIRAPAGSISGVSGYQLKIGASDVYTTGDQVDILIAMNPAALKTNLDMVKVGGIIIADSDQFHEKNLKKADYTTNPLDGGVLDRFRILGINITSQTREALKDSALSSKEKDRCKNFYALGVVCWMLSKDITPTIEWINKKFKSNPDIVKANHRVLEAGYNSGEARVIFGNPYVIRKEGHLRHTGCYRYINGNTAAAFGLAAAGVKSGRKVFLGSYPITPATEIMQELSKLKNFNIKTFQAEDEIAGIGTAIGASYAGALGATSTSGPGLALKAEFLGLAVISELPLVVIDVQRAGPSTGLPTKTEQSDLMQALYGRNGDCPLVVIAAKSPGDCFHAVYEAARIAVKYMTPVIVLSDGYLANGAEGWRIPELAELPAFESTSIPPREEYQPYGRDPLTLARPWVVPGTAGYEHRIGSLEKEDGSGVISQDPDNHEKMTRIRAAKVKGVQREIPPIEVFGREDAELLVVSWGSTNGAAKQAVSNKLKQNRSVAHINLRFLNPLPADLGTLLSKYSKILVPEVNLGQLATVLRAEYLINLTSHTKVRGRPFRVCDVEDKIEEMLGV